MMLAGSPLRLQHPSDALAAGIGFVHQRPPFITDLPITENFLLGLPYQHRLVPASSTGKPSTASAREAWRRWDYPWIRGHLSAR